jgi:hypothetical protein
MRHVDDQVGKRERMNYRPDFRPGKRKLGENQDHGNNSVPAKPVVEKIERCTCVKECSKPRQARNPGELSRFDGNDVDNEKA